VSKKQIVRVNANQAFSSLQNHLSFSLALLESKSAAADAANKLIDDFARQERFTTL
jgi:hypothetical protein